MTRTRRSAAAALVAGLATAGALVVGGSAVGAPPDEPPGKKVREEAVGVNDGSKKQATGVQMRPIDPGNPSEVMGETGKYGGCTPGYGKGKECLPPVPPSAAAMRMSVEQHPWTCGEVRLLVPAGLRLDKKGDDPLGLDRDGDGVACSPGD